MSFSGHLVTLLRVDITVHTHQPDTGWGTLCSQGTAWNHWRFLSLLTYNYGILDMLCNTFVIVNFWSRFRTFPKNSGVDFLSNPLRLKADTPLDVTVVLMCGLCGDKQQTVDNIFHNNGV